MGVKHEIREPKYETIWKFKILNFQNRGFGWDGPKSELLLKQPFLRPFDYAQGKLLRFYSGQAELPPSLFYFAGGYVETSFGGQAGQAL